jgi:valyl-tRNA synthetase
MKNNKENSFFLKYKIEGTEGFLTIATTRPGNYFWRYYGINPNDERFCSFEGKKAIVLLLRKSNSDH